MLQTLYCAQVAYIARCKAGLMKLRERKAVVAFRQLCFVYQAHYTK